MSIFDYLRVGDLIRVAQINPRFANIVLNHYIIGKFRLHEKRGASSIGLAHFRLFYSGRKEERTDITRNAVETVSTLELFGHILKHLRYEVQDFALPDWQDMFEFVEKYCPQATKEITISSVAKSDSNIAKLSNWRRSFDHRTTQVTIRGYNDIQIPLGDWFPFLEQLAVVKLTKASIQHYPHLTRFSIEYGGHNSGICEFLHLNPQIQHFQAGTSNNASYVRYLSETLPNLESLSLNINIHSPNDDRNVIHFKNVKEFSFEISVSRRLHSYFCVIGNLRFDQLEIIRISARATATALAVEIIRLIPQNTGLKIVEIDMPITSEQLLHLVQVLPNLKEISFNLDHSSMLAALQSILVDNHVVDKVTTQSLNNEVRLEDFVEITPDSWHLVENELPKDSFIFSRVN